MDGDQRRRLMEAGRAAFNQGQFFEAHEFWEEVWDVADDPDRRWIQGLIQVATGLHKVSGDKRGPARSLLQKALAKLADAPDALDGFDVAELRRGAEAALELLERGGLPDARAVKLR